MELENGELKTAIRLNHANESIKFYIDEHNAMYEKYTSLKVISILELSYRHLNKYYLFRKNVGIIQKKILPIYLMLI